MCDSLTCCDWFAYPTIRAAGGSGEAGTVTNSGGQRPFHSVSWFLRRQNILQQWWCWNISLFGRTQSINLHLLIIKINVGAARAHTGGIVHVHHSESLPAGYSSPLHLCVEFPVTWKPRLPLPPVTVTASWVCVCVRTFSSTDSIDLPHKEHKDELKII